MKKHQFDVELINPPTSSSGYSEKKKKEGERKRKIYLVIVECMAERRERKWERQREKKDSL